MHQRFAATRGFFIGEDTPSAPGSTPTATTGCTWRPAATLANNDPVYMGATTNRNTPFLHGFIKIEQQTEPPPSGPTSRWRSSTSASGPQPGRRRLRRPDAERGHPAAAAPRQRVARWRPRAGRANDYRRHCARTTTGRTCSTTPARATRAAAAVNTGMHVGGVFSYVAFDVNNYRRWLPARVRRHRQPVVQQQRLHRLLLGSPRQPHDSAPPVRPRPASSASRTQSTRRRGLGEGQRAERRRGLQRERTLQGYGETPWTARRRRQLLRAGQRRRGCNRHSKPHRPWGTIPLLHSGRGRLARPVLFRRALKIINGGMVGASTPSRRRVHRRRRTRSTSRATSTPPTARRSRAQRGDGDDGRLDHAAVERVHRRDDVRRRRTT